MAAWYNVGVIKTVLHITRPRGLRTWCSPNPDLLQRFLGWKRGKITNSWGNKFMGCLCQTSCCGLLAVSVPPKHPHQQRRSVLNAFHLTLAWRDSSWLYRVWLCTALSPVHASILLARARADSDLLHGGHLPSVAFWLSFFVGHVSLHGQLHSPCVARVWFSVGV